MEDNNSDKLRRTIEICRLHAVRINESFNSIEHILPIDAETYLSLSNEQRAYLDQYIFRFAKLQDAIGEKLFRSVLIFVGEETSKMSFKDILNKLEKFGAIQSADAWFHLRELRNDVSHDYPVMMDEALMSLNVILGSKDALLSYLESCMYYLSKNDTDKVLNL